MQPKAPATPPLTKRQFLTALGRLGGASVTYRALGALGLLAPVASWSGPARAPAGVGSGKTVAILGAGVSGLAAAYELGKLGYRCVILEALGRAGGRNFTARRGSVVEENNPVHGPTRQVSQLDEGLYLNLGPGRLPFHHRRSLHYCNELNVKLEIYIMSSSADLYQSDQAFGGVAIPRYRIDNDTESYIAELLSKAIHQNALNEEMPSGDRTRLLGLLRSFGDLAAPPGEVATVGGETPRTGCLLPMTIEDACAANPRLPLGELLGDDFWRNRYFQPLEGEWQPTLFQPVGGMDKFIDAFMNKVGKRVQYHSEVVELDTEGDGVTVRWRNRHSGALQTLRADYCLSCIPVTHLKKVRANFSDSYRAALDTYPDTALYKLGWQANERFWEKRSGIYGGISYTDDPITQMWYPSYDYFSKNGTLTGVYTYADRALAFGRMSLQQRIDSARRGAVKLHSEFADEALVPSAKALSVCWPFVPFQGAGVAGWDMKQPNQRRAYDRLLAPDGRFHMIGDQISPLPGWQEGALMSVEHVLGQVTGQRPVMTG